MASRRRSTPVARRPWTYPLTFSTPASASTSGPCSEGVAPRLAARSTATLLAGGDKTGQDRWYEQQVPVAEDLYDEYLEALAKEGLLCSDSPDGH
jgi:hypothetical protein